MRVLFTIFCLLGLLIVARSLWLAYRDRRIAYGHLLWRALYADRTVRPLLFWFMITLYAAIGLQLAVWLIAGPSRP